MRLCFVRRNQIIYESKVRQKQAREQGLLQDTRLQFVLNNHSLLTWRHATELNQDKISGLVHSHSRLLLRASIRPHRRSHVGKQAIASKPPAKLQQSSDTTPSLTRFTLSPASSNIRAISAWPLKPAMNRWIEREVHCWFHYPCVEAKFTSICSMTLHEQLYDSNVIITNIHKWIEELSHLRLIGSHSRQVAAAASVEPRPTFRSDNQLRSEPLDKKGKMQWHRSRLCASH